MKKIYERISYLKKESINTFLIIISAMLLGAAIQYNWAIENNFWNDIKIRIILGPLIFGILFLILTIFILWHFIIEKEKNQTLFKKWSLLNLISFLPTFLIFFSDLGSLYLFWLPCIYFILYIILFLDRQNLIFRKFFTYFLFFAIIIFYFFTPVKNFLKQVDFSKQFAKEINYEANKKNIELLHWELQPVKIKNCNLKRYGRKNDGGYLVCANLLKGVQSSYSYGVAGEDSFGCDLSEELKIPVHQYDCFDLRRPVCPGADFKFHAECINGKKSVQEGRIFDTLKNQIYANKDENKEIFIKMDVEGAEWNSILATPDEVLVKVNQIVFELHYFHEAHHLEMIQKLKKNFYIAHIHYNNYTCLYDTKPFGAMAYEVLFVNKKIAEVDSIPVKLKVSRNRLDQKNKKDSFDCQPSWE